MYFLISKRSLNFIKTEVLSITPSPLSSRLCESNKQQFPDETIVVVKPLLNSRDKVGLAIFSFSLKHLLKKNLWMLV